MTAEATLLPVMAQAVDTCISHVEGGGLPFVGVLVDPTGEVASKFGVNLVRKTGDNSAHAEIVAMRDAMTTHRLDTLAGMTLLATGEPCGLCYRFAINHGIETIYVAVDRDEVAGFGFDYRASYAAFGISDAMRTELFHALPVPHGVEPFLHYLHRNLPTRATARVGSASKGTPA